MLVDCGLAEVEQHGRHRRYRIADRHVAAALEGLGGPRETVTSLRASREQRRLALARTCYDHLAGRLGVALADCLLRRRWVRDEQVTRRGAAELANWDIDVDALVAARRPVVRTCVDWTERRPHVAGGLGAALAGHAFDDGWVTRTRGSRGLTVTEHGVETLAGYGVELSAADVLPARSPRR